MNTKDAKRIVFFECMNPNGFAAQLRENRVDEKCFERLVEAVMFLASTVSEDKVIDRLTIACLFELPWEMENAVSHYSDQSAERGRKVSKMADQMREAINELLWNGLDSEYKDG